MPALWTRAGGRWLAAGLLGLAHPAAAQLLLPAATATPPQVLAIKAAVLPLLARGYQLSLEKAWGQHYQQSLSLTPQLYYGPVSNTTSEPSEGGRDQVRGAGLDVQYRRYLSLRARPLAGLYVAGGPQLQRFKVDFQARSWQPEPGPNGLLYYQYLLADQTETITRLGATAVVGKQMVLDNTPLVIDLFVGLGWRAAWTSTSALPAGRYASGMSNYGSAGFFLPVGIKVGLVL
ncbi:hypothetical protein [Hymenobacter algoricola]|uniref:DUF3575 domain-containing protein n=1 Tax=Hymenobacter algoricola TaxID=486267 RepID=A0ABP7NSM9_9BACT